jgi:hypothetical protein
LINGFVENQKVFKGKIYNSNKAFVWEKLKENEAKIIEKTIGRFKEVNFKEFIKETTFDNELFNSFKEWFEK